MNQFSPVLSLSGYEINSITWTQKYSLYNREELFGAKLYIQPLRNFQGQALLTYLNTFFPDLKTSGRNDLMSAMLTAKITQDNNISRALRKAIRYLGHHTKRHNYVPFLEIRLGSGSSYFFFRLAVAYDAGEACFVLEEWGSIGGLSLEQIEKIDLPGASIYSNGQQFVLRLMAKVTKQPNKPAKISLRGNELFIDEKLMGVVQSVVPPSDLVIEGTDTIQHSVGVVQSVRTRPEMVIEAD